VTVTVIIISGICTFAAQIGHAFIITAEGVKKRESGKLGSGKRRSGNTGVKNVALRKTQALYVKVFEKVSALVSQFAASCAVADFEEASVSAFHHVSQDAVVVVGCWFHYAQAAMKRCNKIGPKESYGQQYQNNVIDNT